MSTPTTFQMFKLLRFWAECFHSNIEEDESSKELGKHCIVKKSVHQHGWPQFQIIFGVTVWLAAYCDGSLCQYIGYPLPASKPTNQHPDTSHLTGCVMMMVSRYRLSHNFFSKFCEPPQRIVTRGQLSRSEIKLVLLGSLYKGLFGGR